MTASPWNRRARGPAWLTAALFATTVAGCADGIITDDKTPLEPVFTVKADAVGALTIEGEPRGALAWTVYDPTISDCLADIEITGPLDFNLDADWETANRLQRCFYFSERGHIETDSAAIEAEFPSTFAIDVATLPDPSTLSGTEGSRLGFSDIYVYLDNNGNNTFDETPRGALLHTDALVGTSRPIREDDDGYSFLVYREGTLNPLWKLFTGIYGCGEPAPGFSTVTISNLDDLTPTCVIDDRALPVQLYENGEAASLACAPDPQRDILQRPLESDPLPGGTAMQCGEGDFGRALFTTDQIDSVCPTVREYSLVGCSDASSEDACRNSFWDIEQNPPSWWPCEWSRALFYGALSEEFATDGIDSLGSLAWGEGPGQIPLDALRIVGKFTPDGEPVTIDAAHITLIDNDGNGVFNRGDRIEYTEPENLFTENTPAGTYTFEIFADVYVEGVVAGEPMFRTGYVPVPLPEVPTIEISAVDAEATIQFGSGDIAAITYEATTGPAFEPTKVGGQAYIGGEYPVTFSTERTRLTNDVNGDGLFGPGDTVVLQDDPEDFRDITPELIQNFGNLLYISLTVEYAYNTVGTTGYADVEVQ